MWRKRGGLTILDLSEGDNKADVVPVPVVSVVVVVMVGLVS